VSARLFVGHHTSPDLGGIEIFALLVDQRFWISIEDPRTESLADEATLAVAAIGVESVAEHRLAIACNIGDDRHHRARHFGKIDVGVRNR
jgi:hypothetical protein